VRNHRIDSRPQIQGDRSPLRLRHSARGLTDGAGLILLRRLWDTLHLGTWIDRQTKQVAGRFRPSLMIEVWVALLFYGGGVMDDLPLLERRGVRRIFGWVRIPDPTTFGRWLRRSATALVPLLDELMWRVVLARWALVGVPRKLTLVLDSTVSVRYGTKQAGAEKGYNPKKPGRASHHPLLAFLQETGDCLGVRWRPGSAHTAAGAEEWLRLLVDRLRSAGVEEITVRLDKGFFSRSVVETLFELDVHFLLKIPNHGWLRDHQRPWRRSERGEGIFPGAETWTATGSLWGGRLLSLQARRPLPAEETLELDTYEIAESTHVLTNLDGIHAISAWRLYNQGALIEQRIEELGQLSAGQTAVDHLEANALLWSLNAVAYQLLHFIRSTALPGGWRTAQPKRLRAWLLRMPAKLTTHARKNYVQLLREDPARMLFLKALRRLRDGPPLPRAA
jgi:hypothetical protein